MSKIIKVGNISIGGKKPFVLIAGPCVIEGRTFSISLAKALKKIAHECNVPFIFKASFDKANRTSIDSFRGPGISKGLAILKDIKESVGVSVLSDIHDIDQVDRAAEVLDILQIPAFLCRQTDLIVAAAKTKKVINIKKGQFLAPWDMTQVIKKIEAVGNKRILLTERGVSFGYNNLVSDFRSLDVMAKTGYPVVYDATHSVQQPGGLGDVSGGNNEYVPLLSRCAVAAGISALFVEVHPHPKQALSDGPNSLELAKLKELLKIIKQIDHIVKK
ncbi:MAG: 3-deoxy-8-phosphooctulonate synthase [Candidatus Omnitrophica bacterium]|nr:3-deoxy-8-phosphooctulonate synthase [Candidatus Omnitrophota bacterium]